MNEPVLLFPFGEYWWFYAAFLALVLVLLSLDLGVFHRRAHVVSFRESLAWSAQSSELEFARLNAARARHYLEHGEWISKAKEER